MQSFAFVFMFGLKIQIKTDSSHLLNGSQKVAETFDGQWEKVTFD